MSALAKSEVWPTWTDVCEAEPRLLDLERAIRGIQDDPTGEYFCANEIWFKLGIKHNMMSLVGWHSLKNTPLLRSERAYDVAYEHLYGLLPDCRNCACW